jgi:hypothetical protein
MRKLPLVSIEKIFAWKVCNTYEDRELLLRVTGGRAFVTARDVFDMPISTVDKLWCLLRADALPEPILEAVIDRIVSGLPFQAPDHDDRDRGGDGWEAKLMDLARHRQKKDYWRASRKALMLATWHGLRTVEDENSRQYVILMEEIRHWESLAQD